MDKLCLFTQWRVFKIENKKPDGGNRLTMNHMSNAFLTDSGALIKHKAYIDRDKPPVQEKQLHTI